MLDIALKFLTEEINTHLLTRTDSRNTVEAKVSRIVDDTGKYVQDQNSIGAYLINIEEERVFKSQNPDISYIKGQHVVSEPELKLNLYVIFSARFNNYDDSLKYLSHVMTFFQSHPSFGSDEYPALDQRIRKLVVELQSLGYEQLNQVWAFIGGKQLPSAIYKVRLVALKDDGQTGVRPPVTGISAELHGR